MANNFSFSVMPSVSISRSRFERKSQHKTAFNIGEIVPIYVDEVLPGDTRSFDLASLVRMSTPIAPIMDNVYLDFFAFFVPNRLTWEHWKEFQGENNEGAGIPSTTYSIPYLGVGSAAAGTEYIYDDSLAAYMGLPVNVAGICNQNKISALPFRAYWLIYNRWFRNQNLSGPVAVQLDDTNEALVGELSSDGYCSNEIEYGLATAEKLPDYFTKGLPYAQKGAAVSVPIGTTAPIVTDGNTLHSVLTDTSNSPVMFSGVNDSSLSVNRLLGLYAGKLGTQDVSAGEPGSAGAYMEKTNLIVDLSNATAATINELRYAFQLQKLLEKDALYGTRYWEILAAHFGVTAPDASLQDPEYLGGKRMNINIDQVLSTAGYDASTTTTVGAPGANSVSGFKGSLFTKSFVEHGYLMIMAVARHDQTYSQGINRMWTRQSRYDFYMPVFANLGAQTILNKEIYAQGSSADDEVFGYQEAWAEYRYRPSMATSVLNPSQTSPLDYWTLTNKFAALPTLSPSFTKQNRSSIQRALVTGSTGPDFIADFYFRDVAVRPMPVYSIPGLIDHH